MSSLPSFTPTHPLLACVATLEAAVKDVADVDPMFMRTAEKQDALTRLTTLSGRVEELRLRVLDSADDVAADAGARDAAAWLAHTTRHDGPVTRRDARLATALVERWHRVASGYATAPSTGTKLRSSSGRSTTCPTTSTVTS